MSYEIIAQTALTAAASSVTFSTIPQIYENVVLSASIIPSANANVTLRVNGDSTASYLYIQLLGLGTAARGAKFETQTSSGILFDGVSASTRAIAEIEFIDYANTAKKLTYISRAGSATPGYVLAAHNFGKTNAMTSIQLLMASGNFNSGSQFTLYGVK
jgi:hypothetical protein